MYVTTFEQFLAAFYFSNYIRIDDFKLDHPKEDHNEQEFKRLIINGILDQLDKSLKTREASYKLSITKYNSIST